MSGTFLDNVKSKILSNGMKVICLERQGAPVASFQIWYKTGSINETNGIRGISHILEHMMFRGSENYASEVHAKMINNTGGHCNAFTAEDMTAYLNSVPSAFLSKTIELEAERMHRLKLDEELFQTERQVIIEEYHTYMNNPVAKSFLEFRSHFYKDQPYEISPIGILEDIETMKLSDLQGYYDNWYSPQNAVAIAVGDIGSSKRIFEEVEEHFNIDSKREMKSIVPKEHKISNANPFSFTRKVDFEVPISLLGFPAPPSNHESSLSLDILQLLLTQGETSRFNKSIVRNKNLAVMAGGMNHLLKHSGMTIFFSVFTPDTSAAKVEKGMVEEIKTVLKDGISKEEMEKVKNSALTSRSYEFFSAENICHKLGFAEVVDGDYHSWVNKLTRLNKMTSEQIIEDAREFWHMENRSSLYLKPKKLNPVLFAVGLLRRLMPRGRS